MESVIEHKGHAEPADPSDAATTPGKATPAAAVCGDPLG